jgi:hypothetical protein
MRCAVEENLFVMQAFCLGDWNRIMEEGSWLFRGCALMVEPFDGATMKPSIIPSGVQAWIQIHKIPPLFRNADVLTQLASRVGRVIKVEGAVVQTRTGGFHRARVILDSTKPLPRFVPLALEDHDRMFLQVKYEKLPKFCDHCGLMGHNYMECGSGEHEEAELQFGSWMVSEEVYWRRGTPGARGRNFNGGTGTGRGRGMDGGRGAASGRDGGSAGRGTGGGRGARRWIPKETINSQARKRNSEDAGLAEDRVVDITDTASSPAKELIPIENSVAEREEPGAKKKLDLSGALVIAGASVPPPPPAYVPPKDKKKQRRSAEANARSGMEKNGSTKVQGLAASKGEDRQEQ